jgi:hypothetical protein
MLVSSNFYGLPRALRPDMERVLQGTLDAIFAAATQIHARGGGCDEDSFIEKTSNGIRITDISAGWWAVLAWTHPYKHDLGILDFWIHSNFGKPPEEVDWEKLDQEFMEGRCCYHVQARRMGDGKPWSSPLHKIDLSHPLLLVITGLAERRS